MCVRERGKKKGGEREEKGEKRKRGERERTSRKKGERRERRERGEGGEGGKGKGERRRGENDVRDIEVRKKGERTEGRDKEERRERVYDASRQWKYNSLLAMLLKSLFHHKVPVRENFKSCWNRYPCYHSQSSANYISVWK